MTWWENKKNSPNKSGSLQLTKELLLLFFLLAAFHRQLGFGFGGGGSRFGSFGRGRFLFDFREGRDSNHRLRIIEDLDFIRNLHILHADTIPWTLESGN